MKCVIIGAAGIIGNALFKELPGCTGLTTQSKPRLVTVNYDLPALCEYISAADVVVYCTGVTKFADGEKHPEKSLFLNTQLPLEILGHMSKQQTFVYFSSPVAIYDYGLSAISKYALHKRMAEEKMQQGNVLVIRPSKVIESVAILRDWKTALGRKEKITAFADQFISPINTGLLSDQLGRLLRSGIFGSYNFSASDRLSYMVLAQALCDHFKLDAGLIEAKSARQNNPFFIDQDILDCSAAQNATGYIRPLSQDIVHGYFQALA